MHFLDLTGERFNRWKVIKRVANSKNGHAVWECLCDCGKKKNIDSSSLKSGKSSSCGCYGNSIHVKHGMYDTKLYKVWSSMKHRCNNEKDKSYNHYGGRGIIVYNEWQDDFISFYKWSIANDYKEGLTIDRKDNDGNYEPSNCRWVDRFVQNNNTSRNKPLEYKGKILNEDQWSREIGIDRKCLNSRLRRGWTVERALSTPIRK